MKHNKLNTRAVSRVAHDLRPRILGNYEILEKCQIWVETQFSGQSSFQKLNVENICQNTRKIRYYVFEVLLNFTLFLEITPKILATNALGNKFLALT